MIVHPYVTELQFLTSFKKPSILVETLNIGSIVVNAADQGANATSDRHRCKRSYDAMCDCSHYTQNPLMYLNIELLEVIVLLQFIILLKSFVQFNCIREKPAEESKESVDSRSNRLLYLSA